MSRNLFILGSGLTLLLLALGPRAPAAEDKDTAEKEAVFDMKEVSVFDEAKDDRSFGLLRGQYAECKSEANKEVKAYPKLKSERPLYGTVKFDPKLSDPKSGMDFYFALDESGGTGKGYDRLYFDLNRDLDLTNDPVLKPMKDPPSAVAVPSGDKQVVFDYLSVQFDYGPKVGARPFRILPRLMMFDEKRGYLFFLATVARKGKIRVGTREYEAILAQPYAITGRFDRPHVGLSLKPAGSPGEREYWWGAEELGAMRWSDGKYYTTSTTPTGDKLIVKPYQGEFGLFEIGPGKRNLDKLSMSGSLRSENWSLSVGTVGVGPPTQEKTRQCKLPVGDYLPSYVSLEYGGLQISVSDNYHADGKPRDMQRRRTFGIKIRKDRPFVLDFSNKPEVVFASPAKDQTFKLGDEVKVAAVLTDPVLDTMIRRLSAVSPPKREPSAKEGSVISRLKEALGMGDTQTKPPDGPQSLDPTVTITDSSGKRIAQGKMPFG